MFVAVAVGPAGVLVAAAVLVAVAVLDPPGVAVAVGEGLTDPFNAESIPVRGLPRPVTKP